MLNAVLQKREREEKRALHRDWDRKDKTSKQVEKLLEKETKVRASIRVSTSDDSMTDAAGVEWRKDQKTGWWWWRDQHGEWQSTSLSYTPPKKAAPKRSARRPSDSSDAASESAASDRSWCSSASTAASLTLSSDEEEEARKMEKKLRTIQQLQERKARGGVLNKFEESEIRRKAEIEYAPVMVKLRLIGVAAASFTLSGE